MNDLVLALQRFDLGEYVRDLGANKAGRDEWMLTCPICTKEKLSVNVRERRWRCFVCERYGVGRDGRRHALIGAGGIVGLVRWVEGVSTREAIQFVINATRPQWHDPNALPALPDAVAADPADDGQRVPTGAPENAVALPGILPYMQRRGISWDDACSFGLLWVPPDHGWLQNRIVFPVWQRGACAYWQARACWDKSEHDAMYPGTKFRKTLNPSVYFCSRCRRPFPEGHVRCDLCGAPQQYGSADVLLNLEQAATFPRLAICEGPTSAIRTGPSAVATFGKVLHPQQVAQLVAARVRAVDFLWDGPTETEPMGAWPEMIRAAAQLAPFMDVRLVFLPSGDPGDWRRDELDYFRAHYSRPFGHDVPGL